MELRYRQENADASRIARGNDTYQKWRAGIVKLDHSPTGGAL